ncbi:MAG: group II intron reverse transcriptase/maturase [Dehalococcoidia bacterium]
MSERNSTASTVPHSEAKQDASHLANWQWVDRSVWSDRMLAALVNGVKGRKWFSLIDKVYRPTTLASAWLQVYGNQGAAGVDQQSVSRFASHAERYLDELQADLAAERYCPQAVRRVEIPKGNGKTRPLGIPTVKDRIVQTAVKRVIEPIFEHEFLPMSYGFRPGKGCKDALRDVDEALKVGMTWVVDADLQGYFDSIPHDRLMARVEERISDGRVLALLKRWLTQDIVSEMNRWSPTAGTPQGAIISPLLANLYLHPLDQEMTQGGYRMVRYADDFVILCHSEHDARQALAHVQEWVAANGLTLHPDKTQIGDCRQRGQGFDFLGYRFEAGRRWVRKKSLKAFKDKVRSKTRRTEGKSLQQVIASLNPILRGWFGYFRHAYRTTFQPLDGFIRRRLRAMLRKQERRPGRGNTLSDMRRWSNMFFANAGLFTLERAWRQASQSR